MEASKNTGMESLTELYKIGRGPSSSHTIGPERACRIFKEKNGDADRFEITLYGSLAKTGKGHATDEVIRKTLSPLPTEIFFEEESVPKHPNTMEMRAYLKNELVDRICVYSVGGGSIVFEGESAHTPRRIYSLSHFGEIAAHCKREGLRLWEYALSVEGEHILPYMATVWDTMQASIFRGLKDEGVLPGALGVQKRAKALWKSQSTNEAQDAKTSLAVCAYAFAVSEQDACGETVVTAPTCGASGVLPAVLYAEWKKNGYAEKEILHALLTAGIVGNLIKTNASISGAECGCQAEIGTACAMAAAAAAELRGLSLDKIEYAAEIALEHHLGLTCDPIAGLVQIPCIERNAVAAMRALDAVELAVFLWDTRKISFDRVVEVMKKTGLDMHKAYKETAEGGLATLKF